MSYATNSTKTTFFAAPPAEYKTRINLDIVDFLIN